MLNHCSTPKTNTVYQLYFNSYQCKPVESLLAKTHNSILHNSFVCSGSSHLKKTSILEEPRFHPISLPYITSHSTPVRVQSLSSTQTTLIKVTGSSGLANPRVPHLWLSVHASQQESIPGTTPISKSASFSWLLWLPHLHILFPSCLTNFSSGGSFAGSFSLPGSNSNCWHRDSLLASPLHPHPLSGWSHYGPAVSMPAKCRWPSTGYNQPWHLLNLHIALGPTNDVVSPILGAWCWIHSTREGIMDLWCCIFYL